MASQVISPTLRRTGEDFPRLYGSNFPVWNARIRAALNGQGLFGFIDQEDYDGDSDNSAANTDDEDPNPPKLKPYHPPSPSPSDVLLLDTVTLSLGGSADDGDQADAAAQPKAGHASSDAPSDSSSGNSSDATGEESKATTPSSKAPPVVKSFTETKRDKEICRSLLRAQAKNARAKLRVAKKRAARKPRCMSAFALFQKLRDRYEGSTTHRDPYYINHNLITIKYEEGTDLMELFLTFERALKAAAEATGIVMTYEQRSLCLYHAMPSSWKPDLGIWNGSKIFIPYTDLKTNIERKVMDDYAKHKYTIAKGSPESIVTTSETALQVILNTPHGRDEPPRSRRNTSCTYCQRPNHVIRDWRVLQKHLRTGTVKEGTVLLANFAIIERKPRDDSNSFPIKQKRSQHRSDDRQRQAPRHDNNFKALNIYERFCNPVNFSDLQREFNSRGREAELIAYAAVIIPDIGLSATFPDPMTPLGRLIRDALAMLLTKRLGSKRFVPTPASSWSAASTSYPSVALVVDTTGTTRLMEFRDVLYVLDMKFNLLSIAQVLKMGIRLVFSSTRCIFFVGTGYKIHVELASYMNALLIDGDLPRQLWGEWCQYVTHLINVTTCSVLPTGVTPYELWHGKKASLTYIKVFGCAAFALTPEPHHNKLEVRSKLCMFVDLPQNKKGHRLLSTTENRIIYSRDVMFKEDTFPNLAFLERATPDPLSTSLPVQKELLLPLNALLKRSQASLVAFGADVCSPSVKKVKTEDTLAIYSKALLLSEPIDLEEEHTLHHIIVSLLAVRYDPGPKIYKESSPLASDWHAAALSEYESLMKNQTWTLVPRPHNHKVLQRQWVFIRKRDATGRVVRFKARLVVKGFQPNYGIDYTEIFSPVVRMEVLRLLLTLAAILDYDIEQMDVKIAFLNGSLDVAIFMEQPEGFASKDHPDLVGSLGKSLYGVNQAPRVWYHTFAKYLERLGFIRLVKDRCMFCKVIFNAPCYTSVYVDDLSIISPSKQVVALVKPALSSEFHMTDLGGVSYLLGWTIERNRADRSIFVHQTSYATKVLDRFSMLESHPKSTPIAQKLVADCPTDDETKTIMTNKPYREAVGSFVYLVTGTRPGLAFFIREISQYLDNPGRPHWKTVKHGLHYLNGTKDFGITLGGEENLELLQSDKYLMAYTVSDYAACQDTRRCIGGYINMLCNSPISCVSRRHNTVVLSTMEADYIALWFCIAALLKTTAKRTRYESSKSTLIVEDNQSCVKICNNPELHGRSKHIDIKYFFVQEKVANKEFTISYCNTNAMCADIVTNL
ncbi:LOW QUALITY PROTEIN: Polyprotein [Phytophthora palmivora]|uniref:Polyprotein n=1 Tax=Phytophthora palmivora TaxID=4796 RepID=A0A2P4XFV8_9STRA|nr:LOW QUALITY PROTEIN: Polyprotein [Phytophthora palmivora]